VLQDELQKELADLEQDELNERLAGADHVPVHTPAGAVREPGVYRHKLWIYEMIDMVTARKARVEEDDEEAQLRALQAELES
jgi:charged multivesicular body protein 4